MGRGTGDIPVEKGIGEQVPHRSSKKREVDLTGKREHQWNKDTQALALLRPPTDQSFSSA